VGSYLKPARWDRGWLLVAFAAAGVFFAADDQTSVVAVLPDMIEGVGLPQDRFYRAAWIINAYILGYVVAMPLMGRVADRFGHGRIFAYSLLLFCGGSAWVAMSDSLTILSIGRGVQAVGGGAVVPVAMAIVTTFASPKRRALGLGAMAAASEAGGLIGPLWGGTLADLVGWRGVFWINLPMCLPLAFGVYQLSRSAPRPVSRRIDYTGAALLGLSLVCLTIALTDDPIEPRAALLTVALYALAGAQFAALLFYLKRARLPLIDLGFFRRPGVAAAFASSGLTGGALIVAMVNVPLFTNTVIGGSAIEGGLNLMRLTIALPAGALAGGWLTARYGRRPGAFLGLVLAGAGFLIMSGWNQDPSFLALTLPLLVTGFGFGLVIAPINAAVMDEANEEERATAASLLTATRLLGALVGVALLTTRGLGSFYTEAGLVPLDDPQFLERLRQLEVSTFSETFVVTAAVCFAGLLPGVLLGRGSKAE
jgi:EmrB/QacA subfamily drug resistance transporter